MDESDFKHHEENQMTTECLDFTLNAMKYASQRVSKDEQVGGFAFPLNYMMHERLIPVYLDTEGEEKSCLASSYQMMFAKLKDFTQNFLGVKYSFQVLHTIKHVFVNYVAENKNLKEVAFSEYSENQNRALYTLKTLMHNLTKDYGSVLKQRLISLEMISEKNLSEPLDYYSSSSQDPQKILFRLTNCWLMTDVCIGLT